MFGAGVKVLAALTFVVLFTSCSEAPKAAPKSETATEKSSPATGPVSGKTAFWETYKSAHAWATDKVPLSLEGKNVSGSGDDAGKASVWIATFGSPRKGEARTFTYSASGHAPDLLKGVSVGRAITWNGPTSQAMPFAVDDFSVDSDAALKTALAQADAWVKKHPDKPVSLALGNASRFSGPVWYVLWGDRKNGYAVFVSAKTGEVVK
jgi:hypothetical protein